MRKSSRGYSLIEVLIAMAIMGSVFLSIISLFYLGRRTVYSGKQMTQAVAVGTHVMEDLANLTVAGVYTSFNVGAATTLANFTIAEVTYNNVIVRSTNPAVVPCAAADCGPLPGGGEIDPAPADANINGFLTTWRNEIQNNNKFQDGSVTLVLTPTNPLPPNPVTTIVDAQGVPIARLLQIRAIVQWNEAGRRRSVVLDSGKLRRAGA